jgi:hypothetical protein
LETHAYDFDSSVIFLKKVRPASLTQHPIGRDLECLEVRAVLCGCTERLIDSNEIPNYDPVGV